MGGTVLKSKIIIKNNDYKIVGCVDAWETCLWRIKVDFSITKKATDCTINVRFETLFREVSIIDQGREDDKYGHMSTRDEDVVRRSKAIILTTIGDLIIIRAICPSYYKDPDHPNNPENNPLNAMINEGCDIETLFI